MSHLTQEQLNRLAGLFSGLNEKEEERQKRQLALIEDQKKLVYNDNNEIADSFRILLNEFKEGKVGQYVDIDEYAYNVQKTALTKRQFSRLSQFMRLYGERVQKQDTNADISVPVEHEGIVLDFRLDYQPTMPQYVCFADPYQIANLAVTLDEVLTGLPKTYPERDKWTNKELF